MLACIERNAVPYVNLLFMMTLTTCSDQHVYLRIRLRTYVNDVQRDLPVIVLRHSEDVDST